MEELPQPGQFPSRNLGHRLAFQEKAAAVGRGKHSSRLRKARCQLPGGLFRSKRSAVIANRVFGCVCVSAASVKKATKQNSQSE